MPRRTRSEPRLTVIDRLRTSLQDRYEIDREVGRGGMATVFRARDVRHDRTVAIKVLHPELTEATGTDRFLREVKVTARLSHPHILPLLDSGEADGLLYYVMPFVDGETLRDRLERDRELPVGEAVRLVREVAEALGYAHGLGIVHRDIKPENILLQGGHALVADFGIARVFQDSAHLTMTGMAIGTPVYMSPEQAHGDAAVDARSDLYSLASVAFELLTGEPPYTGPTPMAITARKLTEAVPPLRTRRTTVSAAVEAALTRALQRSPSDRYPTMDAFVAALDAPETAERAGVRAPGRRTMLAGAIGVLALASIAWLTLSRRPAATAAAQSSVAVLPFENITSDSSQAYFVEGLADELVTSLSMVDGMRVASRTSTSSLLRRGLDLKAIAGRLEVENVLEGSVRLASDRIRVATRLVNVSEDRPVWSQTFERPVDDLLRIQEEIAAAIVSALRGRLLEGNRQDLSSGTSDPEAYDLYLQGRSLRLRQTEQGLNRAVEYLRAALGRDPRFARAHAALAESYAVQGWYDFRPPAEAFPAALDAAATALRLEPRNVSALATTAYATLYYKWDLPAAERAFVKAIEADPNSAIAHQWYGNYLSVARRWDEAEAEMRTAVRLEPTAPVRHAVQIWVQMYRGDHARAIASFERAAQFDSSYAITFQWGAMALEEAGRLDDAVAAMERAVALSDSGAAFVAGLARLYAVRGERGRADALLQQVLGARVVPAFDVAKIHLALGDRREAMRWLGRAFDSRAHAMLFLRIDPQLAPLRGEPAFEALARRVGV